MPGDAHRILFVDDDATYRRAALRRLPDVVGIDEAATVAEAQRLMRRHVYECAWIDVGLPDGDGLDLLEWARNEGWSGAALVLSGAPNLVLAGRALLLDGQLIYKPTDAAEFRAFLARVAARAPLALVIRTLGAEHQLTPRQIALLLHYATGTPRAELADVLGIAEGTVKTMVREILQKTGAAGLDELLKVLLKRVTGSG